VTTNQNRHNQQMSYVKLRENWIKLIESEKVICDRYVDICRIDKDAGDGNFSLVFKAKDIHNKKKWVVLKFFNPLKIGEIYRLECFHRESDILRDLRGQKNILPLIQEKTDFNLTFEPKVGLSMQWPLQFYSSELGRFDISKYIYYQETNYLTNILFFREICKAVQRIHKNKIIHRDLKPGNFLVFNKKQVCLSDFGTARYSCPKGTPIRNHYTVPVGDIRYTAPELLFGGLHFSDRHSFCADIYSLGAILFELFAKMIFNDQIFKEDKIDDILVNFHTISESNRIEVFDGFIGGFSKNRELPSIREYDANIPKDLVHEVDMLYRSLACLDYRRRQSDFQRIFHRINICEKVIKYHKKIERWRKKKEERICLILHLKKKMKRD